uniref:autophagy protein 5-like n=1 Tax=Styela clava TaxID=7725 RepID=UPI00193A110A|nr:autophagy protein 5-like [Styela clava]
MVSDLPIVKEVWNGSVMARFTPAAHEISGSGKPPPFYLMLQRNSYLPLINDKIKKHFAQYIGEFNESDIWYDYDGRPLKWHHPIGVLWDLLCYDKQTTPIEITVHFKDFPVESIICYHQMDAIEANFMSMLKEADHLKHRGQVMNNMNKSQHKQLWNSLKNNNFDQFWSINSKLMEGYEGTAVFKYIPLRVYTKDHVFQRLVSPISEAENPSETCLNDCLSSIFKQCLSSQKLENFVAVIQGIEVPLNSKMQWLSEHLSNADNFLHVALINNNDNL